MQAAHDALRRERLVVLHEVGVDSGGLVPPCVVLLHEPAAAVAEHLRLDDNHARDLGGQHVHGAQSLSAACAAARRAIGTRNGEQLT